MRKTSLLLLFMVLNQFSIGQSNKYIGLVYSQTRYLDDSYYNWLTSLRYVKNPINNLHVNYLQLIDSSLLSIVTSIYFYQSKNVIYRYRDERYSAPPSFQTSPRFERQHTNINETNLTFTLGVNYTNKKNFSPIVGIGFEISNSVKSSLKTYNTYKYFHTDTTTSQIIIDKYEDVEIEIKKSSYWMNLITLYGNLGFIKRISKNISLTMIYNFKWSTNSNGPLKEFNSKYEYPVFRHGLSVGLYYNVGFKK